MAKMYGCDIPVSVMVLTPDKRKYTDDFFCGNPSIDYYFSNLAINDPMAVTYIFLDTNSDRVIAYVTIACSAIFTAQNEGQFSTILSSMEILYFAVNEDYKHIRYEKNSELTLSHYIFSYMLYQMERISHETIGAAKVVLYSVPEAVNFYKRCNFVEFGDDMFGDKGTFIDGCVPMYYNLN